MRTHSIGRLAALLVALEGIGLIVLAVWQGLALVAGDTAFPASAIALIVLTLVGAAIVFAFAMAIHREQSWGRSGGIVTQLLVLAVALGAATGAYAHPLIALALAVPAVGTLVLIVLAVRDAGRPGASPPD